MSKKVRNNIKPETIVKYWQTEIEENNLDRKFNTTWEKALTNCWACGCDFGQLERCHIIPSVLGGEMKPENMILMCQFCNKQNPETIYEDSFWRWVESRRVNGFIMINDNPMKYDKEHNLMFGYNFSELMMLCLEEETKKRGLEHAKMIEQKFRDDFFNFLKNNKDKYYTRYPSTMAIALNHYFHIWVPENFTEDSQFIERQNEPVTPSGPSYDLNGRIILPPIGSLKFQKIMF